MPDLLHLLNSHDHDLLETIARAWGVEIAELADQPVASQLSEGLLAQARSGDLTASLPEKAKEALEKLVLENGRLPLPAFARLFGDIRPMGAGKRKRERPDQNPESPAEVLWYAGLIGKAFLDAGQGPQEFVFIPDDLLPYFPDKTIKTREVYGRLAGDQESLQIRPAGDRILDEACTLLAALRVGFEYGSLPGYKSAVPRNILTALLKTCGLLDEKQIPIPEAARDFLESGRADSLAYLASGWRKSDEFNELLLLPGLSFEGNVGNNPLATRQKVLDFLDQIPAGGWVDLASFISDIHERLPDFQRPAGDYDSWFIRSAKDQVFLRGFSNWDKVEGSLLRFFIGGVLHWLGIVDLAIAPGNARPAAFRLSTWAEALLAGQPPAGLPDQPAPLRVLSDGQIAVPRGCPRAVRYQVARACEWISADKSEFRYRITPDSLEKASWQGLKAGYLTSLLKRHHQGPLPPNIPRAVERWEKDGLQASLKTVEILSVDREEIMRSLLNSPAKSLILERINATSAIIRPGSRARIMKALIDLGYLSSDSTGKESAILNPGEMHLDR